jgi:hypothetical protein
MAVDQSDMIGSRNLGGSGYVPGIGDEVETRSMNAFTISAPIPCELSVQSDGVAELLAGWMPDRDETETRLRQIPPRRQRPRPALVVVLRDQLVWYQNVRPAAYGDDPAGRV